VPKESLSDLSGILQIIKHNEFKGKRSQLRPPVKPDTFPEQGTRTYEVLKERDILLHHPYNLLEPVLELLERQPMTPM